MLDFHQGPKPRNYLSRREQGRLLLLVLALGLVVILMFEARKPEHYTWLLPEPQGRRDKPTAQEGGAADDRRLDTRVLPESPNEQVPGTFLAPGLVKPDQTAPSRYFPGVDAAYLDAIRDDKPLGPSEWEPWLHLFNVLNQSDEATLQQASIGPVSFIQLLEQSEEYRGELVTTSGIIRRAHPAKTPRNDYGLTGYYQTWLWPVDHPNDPIAVWCLRLPEGFPTGMEVAEQAEATGFYIKRWAYKAADGNVRRAPMLLARTVHWQKEPVAAEAPPEGPFSLVLMIAAAGAFAVLATTYVYYRTRTSAPARPQPPSSADTLRIADTAPDLGAASEQAAESEEVSKQHSADSDDGPGP